jgi:hypothetical protein
MKTDLKNSQFKHFRVVYNFKHSKMGFQNSITVTALTQDDATNLAKTAVSECYGSKMLPRFTFNQPVVL